MSLLRLNSISKSYAGVPALNAVNLTIERGEIHALMGENGAGKSTLIKILAGVVTSDQAEIFVEDEPVVIDSPVAAHRLGLRFIHQELNVVAALSVAENIFLGRDYPTRSRFLIDWKDLFSRARATLATLGITHINPRQKMGRLSIGDQMLVRISSAFLGDANSTAKIYVMDEPTAALTKEESERLFKVLRELRKSGCSVIYVSHRLDEVMALCDRATVLRDGAKVDTGNIAEITSDDLVSLMIGRRVEEAYPRSQAAPQEGIALEIKDMTSNGVNAVSLAIRKGEIVGIAGLAGAGQAGLLRSIFGAQRAKATRMLTDALRKRPQSPVDAWKAGLAYVPRERRTEGLVLSRSIIENITLPHLQKQSMGGAFLDPRSEAAFAKNQSERVRLKAAGLDQLCFRLSGGNQQKVVFAKALAGNPDVLLLDEPTRGVDVGAKFDIYSIIREMTKNGMAVLLASSDLPELIGMCDRIIVMREGDIFDVLDANGLTEELLISACYGRSNASALSSTAASQGMD